MKKLFAVVLFLCMFCTCAFAESTALSWDSIPEEAQAAGVFTELPLGDDLAILCWIPANMVAVDVSTIEAEVAPVEAYQTEDGACTLRIFALQVNDVDEYLDGLEANGAELGDLDINGIEAWSFVQKDNGVEGVIIPISDEQVLSFACTPVDGDEGWDQVKGVIFSSIQVAGDAEEETEDVVEEVDEDEIDDEEIDEDDVDDDEEVDEEVDEEEADDEEADDEEYDEDDED